MKPGPELDRAIAELMSWEGETPRFSSDIAAAWLLLEKVKKHCPSVGYSQRTLVGVEPLAIIEGVWAIGESPSHAICLAFLKHQAK